MNFNEMRERLRGQTAIITGASSGVGAATARLLSEEGVRVVLVARREAQLQELQAAIKKAGGDAEICAGDAAEEETAESALQIALKRFGRVNILINNAGQGNYKPFVETSKADFDNLFRANVRSGFVFSKALIPHLVQERSGTIVFVSSVSGLAGKANEVVYSATKFAQVGLAQSLSDELRGYGIRVCALCPGGIKTEFAVGRGRSSEVVAASYMMDASEVAENIAFVCMQPPNARIVHLTLRHMGEPYPDTAKA